MEIVFYIILMMLVVVAINGLILYATWRAFKYTMKKVFGNEWWKI